MHKVQKLKLIFYLVILAVIAAVFVFSGEIVNYVKPQLEEQLQVIEKTAVDALVRELKGQVSAEPQIQAPPPLRMVEVPVKEKEAENSVEAGVSSSVLTEAGTITWTNIRRSENSLPFLSPNVLLSDVAAMRAQDMFDKQYFAHVSPSGLDVGGVTKEVGYEYISVGENLALGNFEGDEVLVQAWMDSPGHRANILNGSYTEIGVAVQSGLFEGRTTWIAVQIFGRPSSLCTQPDFGLKEGVEFAEVKLKDLQETIDSMKTEIENMKPRGVVYNKKIAQYNALVGEYNDTIEKTKAMIEEYNSQVAVFNQCIAS